MAAINFEELTILGGEFVNFDEINDITVVDGNAEGGFHLIGHGSGDQMWCEYDTNEWYLKIGRIALMEVGEEWQEGHNNWYGYDETIQLLDIEKHRTTTKMVLKWTHHVDSWRLNESWDVVKFIIVRVPTKELDKYSVKHNFLHHFVFEMENLEEESKHKINNDFIMDDIIIEEEIIEEL